MAAAVSSGTPAKTWPELLDEGGTTARLILSRFVGESKRLIPATDRLLAARIRAYRQAAIARDELAMEDALVAIASAAGLIHQHQRRLRGADPNRPTPRPG